MNAVAFINDTNAQLSVLVDRSQGVQLFSWLCGLVVVAGIVFASGFTASWFWLFEMFVFFSAQAVRAWPVASLN